MGYMLVSGWRRAAVFDPDTATVVQVNSLAAAESSYINELIKTEAADGNVFGGIQKGIVLGMLDDTGLSQLEAWETDRTPVQLVIEGRGDNILFREGVQVYLREGSTPNARDGAVVHVLETEELIGDGPDVHELVNIAEASFLSPEVMEFVFPLEGTVISVGADYDAADTDTLDLIFLDAAGTVLETHSEAIVAGRVTLSQPIPASTYTVKVDFGAAATAAISNRTIRTGSNTDYVSF